MTEFEDMTARRQAREAKEFRPPGCSICNFTGLIPATRFGYTYSQDRQCSLWCQCTGRI